MRIHCLQAIFFLREVSLVSCKENEATKDKKMLDQKQNKKNKMIWGLGKKRGKWAGQLSASCKNGHLKICFLLLLLYSSFVRFLCDCYCFVTNKIFDSGEQNFKLLRKKMNEKFERFCRKDVLKLSECYLLMHSVCCQ